MNAVGNLAFIGDIISHTLNKKIIKNKNNTCTLRNVINYNEIDRGCSNG